jgi:hypothetical protein
VVVIIWVEVPLLAGVSLMVQCDGLGIDWGNEHGLGEVLPQNEIKVADLEFLGELEGCVGVYEIVLFAGARYPCVDRRGIRTVAPGA